VFFFLIVFIFQSAAATADRHFHRVLSVFLRYANEAAENDEAY